MSKQAIYESSHKIYNNSDESHSEYNTMTKYSKKEMRKK